MTRPSFCTTANERVYINFDRPKSGAFGQPFKRHRAGCFASACHCRVVRSPVRPQSNYEHRSRVDSSDG